jgi:hypothetical protein
MPRRTTPKRVAKIAEALLPLAVPISSIRLDERNARRHGRQNLDAIAASLKRFGQRAPLVVSDGVVRAGNGRLLAARELGWTHVAVVDAGDTESEALAYALADNRTAELASWDVEALSEALAEIGKDGAIGWDDDELEVLLSIAWKPTEGEASGGASNPHGSNAVVLAFDKSATLQLRAIAAARGWPLDQPDAWVGKIVEALS